MTRALMIRTMSVALLAVTTRAFAQDRPAASTQSAAERMSRPGPEEAALSKQLGRWDVVASMWPAPGAEPIVTRGIVAERTMIGSILQELMQPASRGSEADFRRLDFVNYDRVEGRWKYVSMDTRFPVSIMPAQGHGPARDNSIRVYFAPQAFVGFGREVEGRLMISDMTISQPSDDRVVKEQRVMMADGSARDWLFVRYEYTRRR